MTLNKIVGMGAIAGALGFSALGLAGVADAAPAAQTAPSAVQHVAVSHAEMTGWGHGGGRGPGWGRGPGFGGPGFRPGFGPGFRPGFGGPGPIGWGGPFRPPCGFGLCI